MGIYTSAAGLMLLTIAVVCFSTSIVDADCPDVTPMKDLDSSRLAGVWYMVEGSKLLRIFKCTKTTNTVDSAGVIAIDMKFLTIGKSTNIHFSGTPLNGERAKLLFQTPAGHIANFTNTIIDTDYDQYVVWMACGSNHITNLAQVTSKRKSMSAANRSKVKKILMDAGISDALYSIDQDDCN